MRQDKALVNIKIYYYISKILFLFLFKIKNQMLFILYTPMIQPVNIKMFLMKLLPLISKGMMSLLSKQKFLLVKKRIWNLGCFLLKIRIMNLNLLL